MSRNWGLVVARGLLGIALGIVVLLLPGVSLTSLVFLFGIYALLDGVASFAALFRTQERGRFLLFLEGVAGIAAGIAAFVWPGLTALMLLYIIAAWSVMRGVFEIISAIELRKEIQGEWMLAFHGALSVLFGLLLVFYPAAGALVMLSFLAAYLVLTGAIRFALGLRLRKMQGTLGRAPIL